MSAIFGDTLQLFSMERRTRPTILGLSDISSADTAILAVKLSSNSTGGINEVGTREAGKLDHHVQSIYYDSDYPILVVQLLKIKLELILLKP